jgi:predicted transcriptional regulator
LVSGVYSKTLHTSYNFGIVDGVAIMEELCDVLFELSNSERIRIISILKDERLKLSGVSKRLEITVTEASRHLQRLSEKEFIAKDSESLYYVTPYGNLIFSLLPAIGFVSENRKYFLEHDTSVLPPEFVARFGELSGTVYSEDTISNFAYEEKMIREATDYCWSAANQFHWSAPPIVADVMKRGVDVRSILPEKLTLPVGFRPAEGVNRRTLPEFNLVVIVTEREAVFGLPYLNSRMDYAQYRGKKPSFIKWCNDLFQYLWDRAKPMIGPFTNTRLE